MFKKDVTLTEHDDFAKPEKATETEDHEKHCPDVLQGTRMNHKFMVELPECSGRQRIFLVHRMFIE